MTLSVTYSCRAALARTPACPRPPRGSPPLCPPTPSAGPGRLYSPARRPPAPNLRRRPLGPRAACTPGSGPAGSATGDWPALALPASYLPRMGRYAGEGVLPASRRTPGSLGGACAAGLWPGPGLTLSRLPPAAPTPAPRHRLRRRPLRLRLALLPHPLPPGAQPPVPAAPDTALGQLAGSPSSRGREVGVSLKTGSWGALLRTLRARGAQRGESAGGGSPNPSPLTPSGSGAYLPESRPWEQGSIP